MKKHLKTELQDEEWQFDYIDHDRQIVRAVVFDSLGYLYFVRVKRNDCFGNATLIETAGGGVEHGEALSEAIKRELKEELGAEVDIVCELGVICDYYNVLHRHNINNYFLCRVNAFGDTSMTEEESKDFQLSTLKLRYEEAIAEYERRSNTRIGRLIAKREVPVLKFAWEIIRKEINI